MERTGVSGAQYALGQPEEVTFHLQEHVDASILFGADLFDRPLHSDIGSGVQVTSTVQTLSP